MLQSPKGGMSPICSSRKMTRTAAWSRVGSDDWKASVLLMLGLPDLDFQKKASKTASHARPLATLHDLSAASARPMCAMYACDGDITFGAGNGAEVTEIGRAAPRDISSKRSWKRTPRKTQRKAPAPELRGKPARRLSLEGSRTVL